jgi:hypothetical protein
MNNSLETVDQYKEAVIKTLINQQMWFSNAVGLLARIVYAELGSSLLNEEKTLSKYVNSRLTGTQELSSVNSVTDEVTIYKYTANDGSGNTIVYVNIVDDLIEIKSAEGEDLYVGSVRIGKETYLCGSKEKLTDKEIEATLAAECFGVPPTTRRANKLELSRVTKPVLVGNIVPSLVEIGRYYKMEQNKVYLVG